jgi:hypothetical protein
VIVAFAVLSVIHLTVVIVHLSDTSEKKMSFQELTFFKKKLEVF